MKKKIWFILIIVFILAFAFRIYRLPEYFASSDNVAFPLFLIDSFPDQSISSLFSISEYGINNPLRLVVYPYSILQPIYYFFILFLLSLFNIPFTEFTFFLPNIIIASLTIFPVYFTVKKLYDHTSGVLASTIIMILPLHIMQSRYLGAPRTLAILLYFIALYYLILFFETPKKHARQISILLSLVITSSIMFPPFLLVVAYVFVVYNKKNLASTSKLKEYMLENIITLRFLSLPLFSILFLISIFLGAAAIGSNYGLNVTMLGHILTKQPSYGFYLMPVIGYIFSGMGLVLGIVSLLLIPLGLKDIILFKKRGILLVWAFAYIIPFLFTSPSNIRAYIIDGVVPLAIYAIITFNEILKYKKITESYILRSGLIILLIFFTMLSAISGTYNLNLWQITDIPPSEGSYLQDYGVKALGYWARTSTPPNATFFFDETIEPPVGKYYFHRISYGLFDATSNDTFEFFLRNQDKIDYITVSIENYPLYKGDNVVIAESVSNGETYYILRRQVNNSDIVKQIIDVDENNNLFDKRFANLESLRKAHSYVSQHPSWI